MSRGHYRNNLEREREIIWKASEEGRDWRTISESLGVKRTTAITWMTSGRKNYKQRGGYKEKKLEEGEIDRHLIDILIHELEKKPQLTLQQMAEIVLYRFGKLVTTVTIANYLQGRLFTIKSVHYEPLGMNTNTNKQRRRENVL